MCHMGNCSYGDSNNVMKIRVQSRWEEILVEFVRASHPGEFSIAELSEATGRSPSWIRRTLRTAGLLKPIQNKSRQEKSPEDRQ
jgi:predicted transcriptional regulator